MNRAGLTWAACSVLALILVPVALAQDEPSGDIARMSYWEAKDGMETEFEEGIRKHNAFHAMKGDPQAIHTWQIVTGKYAGTYARGSFGHTWAELDIPEDFQAADSADAAETMDPYMESDVPVIYRYLADWSRPPAGGGPAALTRVIHFHVKNGKSRMFRDAITKIHKAIGETERPVHYFWYEVVDGGDIPTYIVALPKDNWAGFAPLEQSMGEMLAEVYGEEGAAEISAAFTSVDEQHSATYAYREDLSYLPAAGESD